MMLLNKVLLEFSQKLDGVVELLCCDYVHDSKLVEHTQPKQILMDTTLFKEFQIF